MLSYRHAYHAGNFADVLKHVVLVALLDALARKPAPLCVLDTHAGAGRYDLRNDEALRNREYEHGVLRTWWRDDAPPPVARWLSLVRGADSALAAGSPPRWYPGSPALVASMLREHDRLLLCELHPAEQAALRTLFARRERIGVHARDGYEALAALLPPSERRGLVLMDPSYETLDETRRMTAALDVALQRWSGGVYAIWYPLLAHKSMRRLLEWARGAGRRVLRMELQLRGEPTAPGMHGCGMLVLNTPWRLDEQMAVTLPWLAKVLGEDAGAAATMDWLVADTGSSTSAQGA